MESDNHINNEIPRPQAHPKPSSIKFSNTPSNQLTLNCSGVAPSQSKLPEPPFGDEKLRGLSKEQLQKLYEKYQKENPAEAKKIKRWQKSKGFRGSSVKKGSKAKKFLKKVSKGLKIITVGLFVADWIDGGFAYAAEEAVNSTLWPASELWTGDDEQGQE